MGAVEKKEERSLVRKLAEVKGAVDRIAKNGHNDHFNYDFATESDIAAAVRKEMADRHLIMFPNVTNTTWEKVPRKNGETKLCTLTVEFTLEDGDSGETRKFTILGQGEDSMDKATYKAMTGAEKYALLKLFMIPTGDDPEKDGENRYTPPRQGQPSQPMPPGAPPPAQGKRDDSTLVKFGNNKGKHLPDLDDKDLSWHLDKAKTNVESGAPKFKTSNQAWLTEVQAETVRRLGMAAPPAKSDAPPTNWQKIVELGALFGKTEGQMKTLCATLLPGKKTVSADDVRAVQAELSRATPAEQALFPGVE